MKAALLVATMLCIAESECDWCVCAEGSECEQVPSCWDSKCSGPASVTPVPAAPANGGNTGTTVAYGEKGGTGDGTTDALGGNGKGGKGDGTTDALGGNGKGGYGGNIGTTATASVCPKQCENPDIIGSCWEAGDNTSKAPMPTKSCQKIMELSVCFKEKGCCETACAFDLTDAVKQEGKTTTGKMAIHQMQVGNWYMKNSVYNTQGHWCSKFNNHCFHESLHFENKATLGTGTVVLVLWFAELALTICSCSSNGL